MVLARGDGTLVQLVANILEEFGDVSGLRANRLKSNLFLAGVHGPDQVDIENILGFSLGAFPFRYLGISLAASRLRLTDYGTLIEKISNLSKAWTSLTIFYAGRLELLRSAIQGVRCYWLAIFPIPDIVIDKIGIMCRRFLWG